MRVQPKTVATDDAFDLVRLSRYFAELSPQPMIAVEGTTYIVRYLNDAFARLVGKDATEVLGRPFAEAVPEGEENKCLTLFDQVYRTGTPGVIVEQEHSQTTPPVYWSYSVWAILGVDERPVGVMIQVTDATEVALFRRQAVEMNEQLLLSSTRQHELTETAEIANRLKDEFLATASHELRTPLTAIVGWTRMLRSGDLNEAMSARALETIERNADVQTKLIEDFLDSSRIISGKLLLDMQPVETAPVVGAAVNTVRPAAEAKNIEIETGLDAQAGHVLADASRLQQVFWNLLSNAVKFTPKEGRVKVTLRRVDSQVEISVSDTGEGIEPEFLPYVFDRFRQADGKTTRRHGGLGLGLAIVRNLVEMHGGTVSANSEGRGFGATFSVRLPLLGLYSRAETPAITLVRETSEATATEPLRIECLPKLDGVRVLIVDDDPDTRELLNAVLSQCEAEVITAASAAEALQEIERRKPDVLVSDIGMPDEDGYDLIKKVRELETERGDRETPALALTAYAKAEDRVRALAAGYQVHLSKPVAPGEFALAVANLVDKGQ